MYGVTLYERFVIARGIQVRSKHAIYQSKQHYNASYAPLSTDITTRHNCKLWTHVVGLTFCTITVAKRQSASKSICQFSTDVARWHSCRIDLTQLQWVSISSCCGHALKIQYTHISVRQSLPCHIPEVSPVEPGEA